ncbi:MAG TPA: M14 family zinc carboxypeptidase, partial [Bdellovibrionota bacterium]|nr:M14 family zinc carboxypeptidase [Bdellovibrionota bacterium]
MKRLLLAVLLVHLPAFLSASPKDSNPLQYIKVPATTPQERTFAAELGVSIEEIMSDYVFGTIPYSLAIKIKQKIPGTEFYPISSVRDFPEEDSNFHNYDELLTFFKEIQSSYPSLVHVEVIGKSVEGRDIHAVLISDSANEKE